MTGNYSHEERIICTDKILISMISVFDSDRYIEIINSEKYNLGNLCLAFAKSRQKLVEEWRRGKE